MAVKPDDQYEEFISKLMDNNTTQKYHIEYEGFKFNHLSQALVALRELKAPIETVEKFVKWMKDIKLEDPEPFQRSEQLIPENPLEVLGSEKYYYQLRDYYAKLLQGKYGGSFQKLVAGEFPKLSRGVLANATHALIQIGYGCSAKKDWFVVEGLAYLHDQASIPACKFDKYDIKSLGCGSKDILDVVGLVRSEQKLVRKMNDGAQLEKYAKLKSLFTRKGYALYESAGDELLNSVFLIKFPSGLDGKDFTKDKVNDLANWIINCAIIVYALAENRNDFFLLHGVTSSWALKNVLQLLPTAEDVLKSVRDYLIVLFTVYLIQDHPPLQMNLLKENDGMSYSWESLVEKAIKHEDFEREHMYKLVQVCKMLNEENPGSDMESLYRFACHCCVDYPFHFGNESDD